MKKKSVFFILLCAVVLIVCAQPLPLNAQSGSSTCQVTATAEETEAPPPGDRGSEEEGKEPEPGKTGPTPKPEERENPGTEEGNPEKETLEPESTSIPGEETTHPDTGGDMPGEEPEPVRTGEPETGEQPEGQNRYGGFIYWLLVLSILAALLAGGAFRWLWMLLRFLIFRTSRIRFHGILTDEKSFFIRVKNVQEGSGLVQDMIDSAGSFAELRKEVLKETAITFIPGQSRMRISCTGRNGRKWVRETAAGERRLFRLLEKLERTGEVEVRITCRGTGIDIPLVFRV